ncbi:MAG: helix-turn-helix domain-containing protein [Acidobacteriota bacterium]
MEKYYFTEQIAEKFKSIDKVPEWIQNFPDFKDQIRALREALGMTQEQLGIKVNRSLRSIQQIENGEAMPKITTLQKISDALNTELQILLIPRLNIIDFLNDLADKKAEDIINISKSSSTLEIQTPSKRESKRQKENLKNEILKKRRSILWAQKHKQ